MKNHKGNQTSGQFNIKIKKWFLTLSVKMKVFFRNAAVFFSKHKIIVSALAVIVLLASVCFGVVNHFLNQIDYDDGSVPLATQATVSSVKLYSGEVVDIQGLTKNPDGTYTLPDGRKIDEDGSVWNPDGSVIFYDGSYVMADGTAVLSDGTTIYTNSDVVFQDGSSIPSSGIKVDSKGYATFPDKSVLHISAFTLGKDGTVIQTDPSLIASQYQPKKTQISNVSTGGDEDDDSDDILSDAKNDEKTKDTLLKSDTSIQNNLANSKIWYSDDIINILILGIDYGSKRFPNGRSDAMMVASINKKTKKIKLISFTRSAYVAITGYENTRLSHAHGYGGPALTIDTIQKNYKIRIDNYVSTTFDTFKQLIDQLGGVDITLTKAEASALKSKLVAAGYPYQGAAKYNLNGTLALEYVRLRKIDSDRQRTQRQRNVLTSIANKVKTMNVFEMTALLNKILPLIKTDLTKSEILAQIPTAASFLSGNIEQHVLPHKGSPLTLRGGFEVSIIDWEDEVNYAHNLFYGDVNASYIE